MVMDNITFLLSSFLRCSIYENVIFCWVMHEQGIIRELLDRVDTEDVAVYAISFVASERELRARIEKDVCAGLRSPDAAVRSLSYLPKYEALETEKIDVGGLTPDQTAEKIKQMICDHKKESL